MANTINIDGRTFVAVDEVPAAPVVETPAAPAGSQIGTTLKDAIIAELARQGSQEVGALDVTLNTGEQIFIGSDNHPALSRVIAPGSIRSIIKKQTVEAGR